MPNASPRRTKSPLLLAAWAAADKMLPVAYGVAVVLIPLHVLSDTEWGAWTNFQMVFLIIALVGDFFVLQPMVKVTSEGVDEPRPIITAAMLLYAGFTLVLGIAVTAGHGVLATIFKAPAAAPSFTLMTWLVLTNIIRTVAIRILQVKYRIVEIFFVDLLYFFPLIGLMCYGMVEGTFTSSVRFVHYNLISFSLSSVLGIFLCGRQLIPSFEHFGRAMRRLLNVGIHQGGTGILTVLQQQSDVAIVSALKGSVTAGLYNAARTFFRFFDAIRDAAQLLLVPATSRAHSQERIEAVEEVTELATAAIAAVMIPLSVVMIAIAPWVVPIILRKPDAVQEFQILMASGFVMPFVIVPSAVLLGIGRTRDLYIATLVGTAVLLIGGFSLTWFFSSEGMAIGVVLGTTVTAVLLTERMNNYVPFTLRSVLRRSRSFVPLARKRLAMLKQQLRRGAGNDE